MRNTIGVLFLIAGFVILASIAYANSSLDEQTRAFSPYSLMESSWEKYKGRFINGDGRVLDFSQGEITTSEGQSYAMLRAVWADDRETFDRTWRWTKDNLDRPNDKLFGWRWGKREDGSYGFMPDGGENSASDAESDIALALILASRRWNIQEYRDEALPILTSLWEINTAEANGKRYLTAGNWATSETKLIINPSYFAPYAWRIFAEVDTEHDWNSLIDPAYELLERASTEPLGSDRVVGLPPDWLQIDRATGTISATDIPQLTTHYSYDAVRTPWRIALDVQWFGDERAKNHLRNQYGFLAEEYRQKRKLVTGYARNGTPLTDWEGATMYATSIGYFKLFHPELADEIYREKLVRLYSNDTNSFRDDIPYYEQNWLWFGVGMYHEKLSSYSGL